MAEEHDQSKKCIECIVFVTEEFSNCRYVLLCSQNPGRLHMHPTFLSPQREQYPDQHVCMLGCFVVVRCRDSLAKCCCYYCCVKVAEHLSRSYGDKSYKVARLAQLTGKRWPVVGRKLHDDFPYIEAEARTAFHSDWSKIFVFMYFTFYLKLLFHKCRVRIVHTVTLVLLTGLRHSILRLYQT